MPPADIALFQGEIAKAKRYIEFGSGGSTVYASQLGIDTISVENDRFYARVVAWQLYGKSVRQILSEMGITENGESLFFQMWRRLVRTLQRLGMTNRSRNLYR